jgi:protein-tyrosine phosphatase
VPVVAGTALTPDEQKERVERMRRLEHDWGESYQRIVAERPEAFVTFFEVLAEDDSLPAVFHCAAGRDRTGIAAGLLLGLLGVPHDIIAHDYALTGEYLEPHVGRFARQMAAMDFSHEEFGRLLATTPEPMERFLQGLVTSHGSIRTYLESIGLEGATLERVRSRLIG